MTVELNALEQRLFKTRDWLTDVCSELDVEMPNEDTIQVLQCVNCALWQLRRHIKLEGGIPVCTFCSDLTLLRF